MCLQAPGLEDRAGRLHSFERQSLADLPPSIRHIAGASGTVRCCGRAVWQHGHPSRAPACWRCAPQTAREGSGPVRRFPGRRCGVRAESASFPRGARCGHRGWRRRSSAGGRPATANIRPGTRRRRGDLGSNRPTSLVVRRTAECSHPAAWWWGTNQDSRPR